MSSSRTSGIASDTGKRRAKDAGQKDKKAKEKHKGEKKKDDEMDLDGIADTKRDERAIKLAQRYKQKGGE